VVVRRSVVVALVGFVVADVQVGRAVAVVVVVVALLGAVAVRFAVAAEVAMGCCVVVAICSVLVGAAVERRQWVAVEVVVVCVDEWLWVVALLAVELLWWLGWLKWVW
jgi:ABC-type uncharacterized transport system permease subunit